MKESNTAPDKSDVLSQVLAQRRRVAARLEMVQYVVAVMSGKGGVGKSALTANLAAALGMQGRAVGVLDADLHGASAAAMLGARRQTVVIGPDGAQAAIGVADTRVMSMDLFLDDDSTPLAWRHPGGLAADTFVWRGSLEASVLREFLADTSWGALDFLFVDMPPGADRFETLMRLVPDLSGALVVTIPSRVSYLVVRRAIAAARQAGAPLVGLVENMAGLVEEDGKGVRELFDESGEIPCSTEAELPLLGRLPFDRRLARTTDAGRPFILQYGDTTTGRAILALAEKLEEVLQA